MIQRVYPAAFVLAWAQCAVAQTNPPPPPPPAPPPNTVKFAQPASDADNFIGDRIRYPLTLIVKTVTLGQGGQAADACVPAGTSLIGVGKGLLTDNGGSQERSMFALASPPKSPSTDCNGQTEVKPGDIVLMDPQMLRKSPPERFGWTFGTLVVPYKYQFKGDRSLSGGATLGGYAGYRGTGYGGISGVLIGFAGATKVDVPKIKDGQSVAESVAGVSYGVGVLGTIKDAFKVGLVIGADRVDKKLGYVNNGKAWISFSLGYDFYN